MKRRHPATKEQLLARLHRGLRPRLDATQQRDISLCHHVNLDAIAHGQAGTSMLWDYYGAVLMWWRASRLLGIGRPELDQQLELAVRLAERFQRTGRVAFDGLDYQLAKDGVALMDQLAGLVDAATALEAAQWSEAECNKLAVAIAARQQQDRRAA